MDKLTVIQNRNTKVRTHADPFTNMDTIRFPRKNMTVGKVKDEFIDETYLDFNEEWKVAEIVNTLSKYETLYTVGRTTIDSINSFRIRDLLWSHRAYPTIHTSELLAEIAENYKTDYANYLNEDGTFYSVTTSNSAKYNVLRNEYKLLFGNAPGIVPSNFANSLGLNPDDYSGYPEFMASGLPATLID